MLLVDSVQKYMWLAAPLKLLPPHNFKYDTCVFSLKFLDDEHLMSISELDQIVYLYSI